MSDEPGVLASSPTGASEVSVPPAVTSGGEQPKDDRPVQNVVAEMNRKFQEQQQQLSTLTQALTALISQQTPARPAAPQASKEYTDEELRELARNGSSDATVLLSERAALRQNQTFQAEQQRAMVVAGKLQALYRNYPQLRDASHPLGQQALANKQALLLQGRANTFETDLEACTDAVLNQPATVNALASEAARQSALSAHTVETPSPRRAQPKERQEKPLSPEAIKLSRRMGVSDPQGAIKRFLKRVEDGESIVTPNVKAVLGEVE